MLFRSELSLRKIRIIYQLPAGWRRGAAHGSAWRPGGQARAASLGSARTARPPELQAGRMPGGPRPHHEPAACPPPLPGQGREPAGVGSAPRAKVPRISLWMCVPPPPPHGDGLGRASVGTSSGTFLLSSAPRALSGGAGGGAQAGKIGRASCRERVSSPV